MNVDLAQKEVQNLLQNIKDDDLKNKCELFLKKDMGVYLDSLNNIFLTFTKDSKTLNADTVKRLKLLNDGIIKNAELLSNSIEDQKTEKKLRNAFRVLIDPWFYKSNYFKKSLIKPRGYPGDFEMMEIIYNYSLSSDGIIGKYFDQYYLDSPYAQAVRNRKNKMVEILYKLFSNVQQSEFKVFNIACGPCRELNELFNKPINLKSRIKITCFDHDQEAIDHSKSVLKYLPEKVEAIFLKGDVLSYIRNIEKSKELLGEYDLVYSMGLADYMPDNLFKRMVGFAYSILKSKGRFILAHKIEDNDPSAPFTPKWVCEWVFNKRNVNDLLKLIKNSGLDNYSFEDHIWDASNRVIFITIIKN